MIFFRLYRTFPQTFQITYKDEMWHLHRTTQEILSFNDLVELANAIGTESKGKIRLSPSEYGKLEKCSVGFSFIVMFSFVYCRHSAFATFMSSTATLDCQKASQ